MLVYIILSLYIPYTAQSNQSFNTPMIDDFIVINNFMNKHIAIFCVLITCKTSSDGKVVS